MLMYVCGSLHNTRVGNVIAIEYVCDLTWSRNLENNLQGTHIYFVLNIVSHFGARTFLFPLGIDHRPFNYLICFLLSYIKFFFIGAQFYEF